MGHSIFGVADEYKVYCWRGGNFDKAKTYRDFKYSDAEFFNFKNQRFEKCSGESAVYEISPDFAWLKANNFTFLGDVATAFGNDIP